ncbi:MAG TPA: PhaM family polyhydroxyalkanoate granule multifunctional regulatory protein [Burkholderiales bacterium]|jgi:hypothetical protein|nr:PhaM family polyhydroxyalkanoate granule multifunctional regulatory protein [Burkholderiales bacterium]
MAESDAPPQDPFEVFRRLWGPFGVPVPGLAVPTMDPREVEKRVADLKSVEAWLAMNLNMVRFAIQGLELQRAALQAMQGGAGDAAAGAGPAAGTMLWPWALMQQAMQGQAPAAAEPAAPEKPKE